MKNKSRQQKWAEKQRALGNCMICGKKAINAKFCKLHKLKEAKRRNTDKYRSYHKEYERKRRAGLKQKLLKIKEKKNG